MGWDRGRIKVLTELPRDAVGFSCDVSGLARIEELGEAMDMDLEDGEIDTVGGLILNLLEAPAEKGDTVGYRGLGIQGDPDGEWRCGALYRDPDYYPDAGRGPGRGGIICRLRTGHVKDCAA